MTEAKWKTETFHTIEYDDFDNLVREHLGLVDFEIVANEELRNDMTLDLGEFPRRHWNDYDEKDLQSMLETGKVRMYGSSIVMEALLRKQVIPAGKWLVKVFW